MSRARVPFWVSLPVIVFTALSLSGCLALAAGAAGGVVGHEIAENNDDDD